MFVDNDGTIVISWQDLGSPSVPGIYTIKGLGPVQVTTPFLSAWSAKQYKPYARLSFPHTTDNDTNYYRTMTFVEIQDDSMKPYVKLIIWLACIGVSWFIIWNLLKAIGLF